MSGRSIHLIDRDELLATLEQDINVSVTGEENMEAVRRCLQEILDDVKESPVVDAVPVIKCKDCKYFELDHFDNFCLPTENGEVVTVPIITSHEICSRWSDGCKTSEDGYCYLAERKEE